MVRLVLVKNKEEIQESLLNFNRGNSGGILADTRCSNRPGSGYSISGGRRSVEHYQKKRPSICL